LEPKWISFSRQQKSVISSLAYQRNLKNAETQIFHFSRFLQPQASRLNGMLFVFALDNRNKTNKSRVHFHSCSKWDSFEPGEI
jgi:hypothetical protein